MSASPPSRKICSPAAKWTLRAQPASSVTCLVAEPLEERHVGEEVFKRPWHRRSIGRTDRGDLLGDVDADRAPGDAAAAADAPGRAELVVPGAELVRHPLPVARASRGPDAAAVDVRVVDREARVPDTPPLRLAAGEVGLVLDGRAEAGRADERAVAAREAAVCDVVPARMLEVAREQVAEVEGLHRAAHLVGGGRNRLLRGLEVGRDRRAAGELGEHLGTAVAAGLDEEPVLAVEELRQREVGARLDLGTGAHRRAEAGRRRARSS